MKKKKSALSRSRVSRLLSRLKKAAWLFMHDPIRLQLGILRRLPFVKRHVETAAQRWQPRFSNPPRITSLDVVKLRFLLVAGEERKVAGFLRGVSSPPAAPGILAREYITALNVIVRNIVARNIKARKNGRITDRMFFLKFVCKVWTILNVQPAREDQLVLAQDLLSAVMDGKSENKEAIIEGLERLLFDSRPPSGDSGETRQATAAETVWVRAYENLLRALLYSTHIGRETQGPQHPLMEKKFSIEFQENVEQRLQPWRRSRFYSDFVSFDEVRRQERQQATSIRRRPGPTRVLIVTENWNFAAPLPGPFAHAGLEVRTFSFREFRTKIDGIYTQRHYLLPGTVLPPSGEVRREMAALAPLLDELIEWSDIVMTDWCNHAALWLSRYLRDDKKLVVRMHSYEAFSNWPYFMNWGGVDGMIYVADTIRGFAKAQHGERMRSIQEITLPNVNSFQSRPPSLGDEERSFVLGMAGYSNANKNPVMALEILKILRAGDERWRLRLIGHPWRPANELQEPEQHHRQRFMELLEDPLISGSVTLEPFSDAVEDWFGEVGFTLSCSEREGTHEVAVEGMCRGSVPVLRNWPMVRKFGGPAAVFAGLDHLVFEDAGEAAAVIKREHQKFGQASSDARQYFSENFAAEVVAPRYAAFLEEIAAGESTMESAPLQAVQTAGAGNP